MNWPIHQMVDDVPDIMRYLFRKTGATLGQASCKVTEKMNGVLKTSASNTKRVFLWVFLYRLSTVTVSIHVSIHVSIQFNFAELASHFALGSISRGWHHCLRCVVCHRSSRTIRRYQDVAALPDHA